MDWSSIASCIAHIVSLLSGPKFKYEGITGLTVRVITDKPYHYPAEFYSLRCGVRFRVVPSWITKRYTAENARGRIEIYDDQGRLVHGSLSVWIPNHDDFWAFSKTVIGKETHLPVSVDITGEGTLLLLLAYSPKEEGKSIECPIKSPDESALIILPSLPPGATTWQPLADSECFNYNGYNGQPICNVKGSLRPNYKVRFMVDSHNARGTKHELTLSEFLDKCVSSCKIKVK
jgi:hypothetical protein